jgi:hypothetical protein
VADISGLDEQSKIEDPNTLEGEGDESLNEKILEEAKARFELAQEAESEIRKQALEDLEFRAGKQWPDEIKQDRERDGRPCLVINRLPQFIQQVTNDQRQNRPSIKVHPVDDNADLETAKIIQGLIRHIEYNSNAEVAYDTAFESAASGGFGYFRVITDFVDPKSFDQEILIKRIRNPFSVYFDPYSSEPDGSDASWAFITEDLSKEDFKSKYPDSKLAIESDWDSIGNSTPSWIKEGSVRVAEYFYKSTEEKTLHLLDSGESVLEEELEEALQAKALQGQPAQSVRTRKTQVPVIKWCKLNGFEVLEETQWPGTYIPIVPVYGNELYVNGKRILESVIRNAKDPQRMLNYWKSAETEAIALAPRAPFIGAEGQFEGFENDWANANRRNYPYLQYRPVSLNGQPQPPPQRQAFEPAVQAITQASMMAADDLKATTGIYDASLGAQSSDSSGIAIQRRNTQAQTSNFHFIDNLSRSIKHAGRILVDLLPKVYDTARTARIIGDDGEQKIVQINQPFTDESGKPMIYALDVGRYDVTVDVGPSFASKRQEAATSMLDVARSYPQLMQVAGDLFVKNMDWPGAQELADRIKKTIPANLIDDPKKGQPLPPQVQAQMQQMNQMIHQLTDHLNEANEIIKTKKLDLEHRERIELMKLQVESELVMAKLGSQESMALLKHEVASISERLKMLSFDQPIDAEYEAHLQAQQQQSFAPQGPGAPGADVGPGAQVPTGGPSPGQPMEGNP